MKQSEKARNMLIKHYQKYPELKIQDLFKYIFQSSFGCEHLVSSQAAASEYILLEREAFPSENEATVDTLDGEYSRIPLSILDTGLSAETLAALFLLSSKKEENGRALLEEKLAAMEELILEGTLPFCTNEFARAKNEWKASGFGALHHSEVFRKLYKPSYRVISNEFLPYLPLLARIDRALAVGRVKLAIEGGSASGKTTLAQLLSRLYDCTVFHIDDFFLRPEQRIAERYAEVGGNVDRERFLAEVLHPLSRGEDVIYRRFDCATLTLCPPVSVTPKRLAVIEGVYSMHPELASYYDLSVFLDISPELQKKRIEVRNSPEMAIRFYNEWIPLEVRYFSELLIKEKCDICISTVKTSHG